MFRPGMSFAPIFAISFDAPFTSAFCASFAAPFLRPPAAFANTFSAARYAVPLFAIAAFSVLLFAFAAVSLAITVSRALPTSRLRPFTASCFSSARACFAAAASSLERERNTMADAEISPSTTDDLGTMSSVYDVIEFSRRIVQGKGMESATMTAVNTFLDVYNLGKGTTDIIEGAGEGDTQQELEGVHDVIDGGVGLAATLAGSSKAAGVIGAFGAGFSAGDLIAPLVYDDLGEHENDLPDKNGVYHPSSGNDFVDHIIGAFVGR